MTPDRILSRREFLRLSASFTTAAVLAGCKPAEIEPPAEASKDMKISLKIGEGKGGILYSYYGTEANHWKSDDTHSWKLGPSELLIPDYTYKEEDEKFKGPFNSVTIAVRKEFNKYDISVDGGKYNFPTSKINWPSLDPKFVGFTAGGLLHVIKQDNKGITSFENYLVENSNPWTGGYSDSTYGNESINQFSAERAFLIEDNKATNCEKLNVFLGSGGNLGSTPSTVAFIFEEAWKVFKTEQ